jgi:hypothetical protein
LKSCKRPSQRLPGRRRRGDASALFAFQALFEVEADLAKK